MTDPTVLATITAVSVTLGLLFQIVLQIIVMVRSAREVRRQRLDAKAMAHKLDENLKVTHDTHTLVNSNMGEQLQLGADLSRWKANQTKGTPDEEVNERAAKLAEEKLRDHQVKQAKVDAGGGH